MTTAIVNLPAGTDERWADWARPLAAALRSGPRTRAECLRLSGGAGALHAQNVLAFLELEGLVASADGLVTLSSVGERWVGSAISEAQLAFVSVPSRPRAPRGFDLRPFTYGWLHPLERAGRNGFGDALWLCACECGETTVVSARHLRTGHTRSCGCLREVLRQSGLQRSAWVSWRAA